MIHPKNLAQDSNERAFQIGDILTLGESALPPKAKNRHAVALGRRGGLKGGVTRASRMSAQQRRESAQKAARARWKSR